MSQAPRHVTIRNLTLGNDLPLVLIAGCQLAQLAARHVLAGRVAWIVVLAALAQTVIGLNPFILVPRPDGHGYALKRTRSGENVANFDARSRQVSWHNLAEAVRSLQQDQGATLLIADSPETASALSFYLPHNPLVYVQDKPGVITQFDFWNGYTQNASPNDSALYIAHSTNPDYPADAPLPEMARNFASVQPVPDPPLPEFDKSWDIWSCQNFIGSGGQPVTQGQPSPMHDSDALPK